MYPSALCSLNDTAPNGISFSVTSSYFGGVDLLSAFNDQVLLFVEARVSVAFTDTIFENVTGGPSLIAVTETTLGTVLLNRVTVFNVVSSTSRMMAENSQSRTPPAPLS